MAGEAKVGVVGKALVAALNWLPFNGDKTKLALWVAILAAAQVITGYDLGVGVPADLALPASIGAAVLFLLHRLLKDKLGLDKWGEPKAAANPGWGQAIK